MTNEPQMSETKCKCGHDLERQDVWYCPDCFYVPSDPPTLEACPLCGATPVLHDVAGWEVDCYCGLNLCLPSDATRQGVITAWNRRAEPADIAGRCGNSVVAGRFLVGCDRPFKSESEIFRCYDCEVPFHRDCLKKHCKELLVSNDHDRFI